MALDTKEKRQNATGVGRPWMRSQFPVATPDEQWRIGIGNAYGGNVLTFVVSAAAGVVFLMLEAPVLGAPASDIGMVSRRNDRRVVGAGTPGIGIVRRRK